ncbi:MAG: SusC/RagA family TonB-linked outer membrane protein, partial [Candidatus Cryptobacteroides sp.]
MKRIELLFTAILLLFTMQNAFSQNILVSGTVVDSQGVPLIGATVMVENTTTGTNTDVDGHYSLSVPADARLVFSTIGYANVVEEVNGRRQISVIMKEDSEYLDATIVIGYGTGQKIGNIVGSVTTVSSDELAERPSANIGDALQGKVAGLQIFNTSGEPQSSVSIRLRGESSLNLSTAPLYILDGVPVSSGVFTSLNPQDIENISVLKDASSTAIYGSRAANGVIFISTKKGKKGEKPSISIRGQYGVSMLTNYNMDMMNSEQLFRFEEMCVPSLKDDVAYQARKAFVLGNGINFDWTDYLFDKAAPIVQADASIRGASDKTNYYVSLGYYSEQGTAKANSGVDRFTFRTNLDTQITDWLKFGANVALTYAQYSTIITGWYTQSPILQAVTKQPYYTPYNYIFNEDGTISYGDPMMVYPWDNDIDLNIYYKNNTNSKQNMSLMGQTYFLLTPIEGLTIRAQQAIDGYDYLGEGINLPSYTPYAYRGRNQQAFERYYQLSSTNTAEYRKDWNQEHFFSVLLGHESFIKYNKTFSAVGTGLSDDRITTFGATTEISDWGGDVIECAFNSFFLNANYSYQDRYFFDASVRTDGSSLFGKNHKYA